MNPGGFPNPMNPDDDDESVRALNRALLDYGYRYYENMMQQRRQQQEEHVPRPILRREPVYRDHAEANARLVRDYFAAEPRWGPTFFRRRFRMRRDLFVRIADTLEGRDEYFQQRPDASGRPGLSTLQKCTAAMRQLAYGCPADIFDEYLHVADTTGRECLKKFCHAVVEAFGDTYLRRPNAGDCQYLLNLHQRTHGFPGMLGSIDCMHWEWKNCPTAWRGQFTSGYKGTHPTMILEAVADQRLWIWHAYFGVAGSNNDINVLNSSPLFNELCRGRGPAVDFTVNGRQHRMGYYLADGIYPRWPVFLKTITCPTDEKRALFAQRQEAARKDVERAFGVLQSRWAIVKGPARLFYRSCIADVMYACIIMHNMIVEDEGDGVTNWGEEDAGPSSGVAHEPQNRGLPIGFNGVLRAFVTTREEEAHSQLQRDMIEEIWSRNR